MDEKYKEGKDMFRWILFPCMKNGILREIDEEKCNVGSMRHSAIQKCFNLWKKHKKLFLLHHPQTQYLC